MAETSTGAFDATSDEFALTFYRNLEKMVLNGEAIAKPENAEKGAILLVDILMGTELAEGGREKLYNIPIPDLAIAFDLDAWPEESQRETFVKGVLTAYAQRTTDMTRDGSAIDIRDQMAARIIQQIERELEAAGDQGLEATTENMTKAFGQEIAETVAAKYGTDGSGVGVYLVEGDMHRNAHEHILGSTRWKKLPEVRLGAKVDGKTTILASHGLQSINDGHISCYEKDIADIIQFIRDVRSGERDYRDIIQDGNKPLFRLRLVAEDRNEYKFASEVADGNVPAFRGDIAVELSALREDIGGTEFDPASVKTASGPRRTYGRIFEWLQHYRPV